MLLVIDNYDSFTYNLVQYFGELGEDPVVFRHDAIEVEAIARLAPDWIVLSPGPKTPKEAGICCDVIRSLGASFPILGVCLGHQCIGEVFGGRVVRAARLMHGKTSPILHRGQGIFSGIPSPFEATRYHSLLVERETLPECLRITAESDQGEIMGLEHCSLPIYGVQFHPESILTREGKRILENFLNLRPEARRIARESPGKAASR
ncbi:anthranilate synthase component II [Methylacidimicrobium cyclopophantes]|uniref:Anthranilate synthase component II n=1 Tax=Methylacidimicrobium cyclopophantes TaxID=1041766 RepID=A0A5E6MDA0_9BACT|nr:aminodeoxychorismate/anthranilate synthase component II [Methylacidimicrobium cyclopophantes]VVM06940.1 anthranilate synthase component II [Methylacidimicrobium cyclopophantes]